MTTVPDAEKVLRVGDDCFILISLAQGSAAILRSQQ
jgi:hypothetical protein